MASEQPAYPIFYSMLGNYASFLQYFSALIMIGNFTVIQKYFNNKYEIKYLLINLLSIIGSGYSIWKVHNIYQDSLSNILQLFDRQPDLTQHIRVYLNWTISIIIISATLLFLSLFISFRKRIDNV